MKFEVSFEVPHEKPEQFLKNGAELRGLGLQTVLNISVPENLVKMITTRDTSYY